MTSKVSSGKKSGECCYPKCKCPEAMEKHKNTKKKKKPTKKEKKNARPYKTSKWLDAMALRPPGALKTKRMAYEGFLPERILNLLDKYFEQSMQTMYSQRSRFVRENYGQPESKPKAMDKKDWAAHREWLSVNAKPKKDYSDRGKRRRRVPLAKLTRYKNLCSPKYHRIEVQSTSAARFECQTKSYAPQSIAEDTEIGESSGTISMREIQLLLWSRIDGHTECAESQMF